MTDTNPNPQSSISPPLTELEMKDQFLKEVDRFIDRNLGLSKFNRGLGIMLGGIGIFSGALVPLFISNKQPEIASLLGIGAALSQALVTKLPLEKRYQQGKVLAAEAQRLHSIVNYKLPEPSFYKIVEEFNTLRIKAALEEPLNQLIVDREIAQNSSIAVTSNTQSSNSQNATHQNLTPTGG
ncbi:hypothetical protein [Oscillatoria sp. FACHB-1406]|uniref:hypothetical protein n=1 Tax=Oscillatoria sp. FACHB-1406 TaxID=2692846 RepID=UPI00168482D6|nr:hypothetical protein [Oscillatoria sp. FACHB-1406]MBD2579785.1 hypothetical protein [Oscillatoria sp. FACHB-1406]